MTRLKRTAALAALLLLTACSLSPTQSEVFSSAAGTTLKAVLRFASARALSDDAPVRSRRTPDAKVQRCSLRTPKAAPPTARELGRTTRPV